MNSQNFSLDLNKTIDWNQFKSPLFEKQGGKTPLLARLGNRLVEYDQTPAGPVGKNWNSVAHTGTVQDKLNGIIIESLPYRHGMTGKVYSKVDPTTETILGSDTTMVGWPGHNTQTEYTDDDNSLMWNTLHNGSDVNWKRETNADI